MRRHILACSDNKSPQESNEYIFSKHNSDSCPLKRAVRKHQRSLYASRTAPISPSTFVRPSTCTTEITQTATRATSHPAKPPGTPTTRSLIYSCVPKRPKSSRVRPRNCLMRQLSSSLCASGVAATGGCECGVPLTTQLIRLRQEAKWRVNDSRDSTSMSHVYERPQHRQKSGVTLGESHDKARVFAICFETPNHRSDARCRNLTT